MSVEGRAESIIPGEIVKLEDLGYFDVVKASTGAIECIDGRPAKTVGVYPEYWEGMSVDGKFRPLPHHDDGSARIPGGSFGLSMILLGAIPEISPMGAVNVVAEWQRSEGGVYTMHTDDIHESGKGCGHIDTASKQENAGYYLLDAEKLLEARKYALACARFSDHKAEVQVLEGEHTEAGVLIVNSKDKTIRSNNGNVRLFRYDKERHGLNLRSLTDFIKPRGYPNVEESDLVNVAARHMLTTVGLLADGKPLYYAFPDREGGEAFIKRAGIIQKKDFLRRLELIPPIRTRVR